MQETIPLKVAMGVVTLTLRAVTSMVSIDSMVMAPPAVIFTTDPLECSMVSDCAPSSSTTRCPEFVDSVTFGAPAVSSNSI